MCLKNRLNGDIKINHFIFHYLKKKKFVWINPLFEDNSLLNSELYFQYINMHKTKQKHQSTYRPCWLALLLGCIVRPHCLGLR